MPAIMIAIAPITTPVAAVVAPIIAVTVMVIIVSIRQYGAASTTDTTTDHGSGIASNRLAHNGAERAAQTTADSGIEAITGDRGRATAHQRYGHDGGHENFFIHDHSLSEVRGQYFIFRLTVTERNK